MKEKNLLADLQAAAAIMTSVEELDAEILNRAKSHLEDYAHRTARPVDRLLAAWCYWSTKQIDLALSESESIDSSQLNDEDFISCLLLNTACWNCNGKYDTTVKAADLLEQRFGSTIVRSSLPILLRVAAARFLLSDHTEAIRDLNLCIEAAHHFSDDRYEAVSWLYLGTIFKNQGKLKSARGAIIQSVHISPPDDPGLFPRLLTLSNVYFALGEFKECSRLLSQCDEASVDTPYFRNIPALKIAHGRLQTVLRDYSPAREYLESGLRIATDLSLPREEALAYEFLGDLELAEGNDETAGGLYAKGMTIALRIAPRGDMVTEIGRRQVELYTHQGRLADARTILEQSLALAIDIHDRREEAALYRAKGRLILASQGRRQSAQAALLKSAALYEAIGARFEESQSRAALAHSILMTPRTSEHKRLAGLSEYTRAAALLGELDLADRQAELLLEAARTAEGIAPPSGCLALIQQSEAVSFAHDKAPDKSLASLRANAEVECARIAVSLAESRPDYDKTTELATFVNAFQAKHCFVIDATGSCNEAAGCTADFARRSHGTIRTSSTGELSVRAGNLTDAHGPRLSCLQKESGSLVVLDRPLAATPFTEEEASDFLRACRKRHRTSHIAATATSPMPAVIAHSQAFRSVIDRLSLVRNSNATVLIQGETGTGKGVLASMLHHMSDRAAQGDLIHVHCAEVPETLIESELFGHVRGAFTGASRDRTGLVEAAGNGTLFLDEIGDLTPSVQLRILRMIEERRIKRVGESSDREVDVRILAATNRDLVREVREGRFREDLYYRLAVVQVEVPPLRDRKEDIKPLAEHFIDKFARLEKKQIRGIEVAALKKMLQYPWPGNVRQLSNEIRRIVALVTRERKIRIDDLSPDVQNGSAPNRRTGPLDASSYLKDELVNFEQEMLHEAMTRADGVQSRAAHMLGISPQLLRYKLKKHGILR